MLDFINGYSVLRKKNILHLDLKPQNIFIKGKTFKIGDFGLAMKLNNQNSKKVQIGTEIYASP
jgi:serine/threonine-protein kinase ULK/ATG1/NUAK family SNF1-like kinase